MARPSDILLTALAPVIWGSTYIVTTQLLPPGYPVTAAAIRALPAGLVLLVALRKFPKGIWIGRSLVLGALNFTIFQSRLFVAAYRLPGGVAATAGAVQPLIVVFVAAALLGQRVLPLSVVATLGGVIGVALLVLRSDAQLDVWGPSGGAWRRLVHGLWHGADPKMEHRYPPAGPNLVAIDGGRVAAGADCAVG